MEKSLTTSTVNLLFPVQLNNMATSRRKQFVIIIMDEIGQTKPTSLCISMEPMFIGLASISTLNELKSGKYTLSLLQGTFSMSSKNLRLSLDLTWFVPQDFGSNHGEAVALNITTTKHKDTELDYQSNSYFCIFCDQMRILLLNCWHIFKCLYFLWKIVNSCKKA